MHHKQETEEPKNYGPRILSTVLNIKEIICLHIVAFWIDFRDEVDHYVDWQNIETQVNPADEHQAVGECLEPCVGNVNCYLEYWNHGVGDVMH